MFKKLDSFVERKTYLEKKLSEPEVINNNEKYQELTKEHSVVKDIVDYYKEYKSIERELQENKKMLKEDIEEDFRQLVEAEIKKLKKKLEKISNDLKIMLIPPDPMDSRNIIIEIRAGTGGEEAALFAASLFRMYTHYAERQGWKVDVMSSNPTGLGGYKEIVFSIEGKNVYKKLKYEVGVHRVQRVPTTESSGRIHTSAASVMILAEPEAIEVQIDPKDLKIDTYRAGGKGGQHVNRTDSAVRITHEPSGLVVQCQDERSQHKNKTKAMRVLRARLLEKLQYEQDKKIRKQRRSQVRSGDRSEKIRTYNYPQSRVTEHRIGLTVYNLEEVLDGDLDQIIQVLLSEDYEDKLKEYI